MTDHDDNEQSADDEGLESLARALVEGRPVDWAAAEARAGDRAGLVRQMRVLSEVASLHRAGAAGERSNAAGNEADTSGQGLQWGHLTILECIGTGGFGEVFRARDRRLDREVALKLLHRGDGQADGQETIYEGRLLARVRHPNVLTVYGAECIDGRVGVWTEFLYGRTLAQLITAHGPFSPAEVVAIGIDLCRALAAVHDAGLLHLDIKAQNVMRTDDGRVVLLDFGAGRDIVARATVAPADLRGTPLYLAPELWRKETPTPQSDIYSLGVLLYYLLTAAYPFEAASTEEIRDAQEAGRLRPLRLVDPRLPDALVRVVERALTHSPAARFESAAAFGQALTDVARPADPTSIGATAISPRIASVGVLLLVATLLGIGYLGWASRTRTGSDAVSGGASREKLPITCAGECRPSSDGRYIVRESATNITLWDSTTGKTRPVLAKAGKAPESPAGGTAVLSADNRTVAYAWRLDEGKYELRVADVQSGETRTVLAASSHQPWPNQWTQDGRYVLCLLERGGGRWAIAMVEVARGSERVLATVSEARPGYPSLSPDGRYVVYDVQTDPLQPQRDIFIVPVHGGSSRALIAGPANDRLPRWTPDGTRVFFTSDRTGSTSGWLVDVAGGVASGEPRQIVKDFGGAGPIAFARDGSLFYFQDVSDIDVYALAIARDVPAGAKPRRVAPAMAGRHSHPSWSPDGRFLAYLTFWPVDTVTLTIQTVATGHERHIPMPIRISKGFVLAPQWAADGGSVALRGADASDRRGFFRMDIATGRVTPLLMFDPLVDEGRYRYFEWTPDGRAFNYRKGSSIVRRDPQTDAETLVTDGITGYFSSSPDGRLVAAEHAGALWVIGPGASRREIAKPVAPERLALQGWTSDGTRLLYTTFRPFRPNTNPDRRPHRLWSVAAGGGTPTNMNVSIPGYTQAYRLAFAPDQRQLLFTRFADRVAAEPWVMRRFLPPLTPAAYTAPSR